MLRPYDTYVNGKSQALEFICEMAVVCVGITSHLPTWYLFGEAVNIAAKMESVLRELRHFAILDE